VLRGRPAALARRPLRDPAVIQSVLDRLPHEEGQLQLSATALERFAACPLRFLFEQALGLGEEVYSLALEDPREVGMLLHGAMQRFFAGVLEEGGVLVPTADRRQAYRQSMRAAVDEECRLFEAANPSSLRPVWRALRARVRELADACLQRELSEMAGERTVQVEASLRAPLPSGPAVLVGKIDRLTCGGERDRAPRAAQGLAEGYTVLDYKKNRLPARTAVLGPAPTSFQMPFYVHLLETHGCPVRRVLYYSFEKKRFQALLRPGNPADRAQMDAAVAGVLERLARMCERLQRGDYSLQGAGQAACSGCPFPALCRSRYVVEG